MTIDVDDQSVGTDSPDAVPPRTTDASAAVRIVLEGHVQGCGLRPALFRLTQRFRLAGAVWNSSLGVVLEVEGAESDLSACFTALESGDGLPDGCRVDRLTRRSIDPSGRVGFHMPRDSDSGPLATAVPPDVAACPQCLRESLHDSSRRTGYPLTTCAACGPRFSLIHAMPFERTATGMAEFPFCPDCRTEYETPSDRRFHAQTMGCPQCGPNVWTVLSEGRGVHHGADALAAAIDALRSGRIVAVRGVGGYQLLVDAGNEQAVARLRVRKHRSGKPLAVLVSDCAAAEALAELNDMERRSLASPANPIVVLKAKPGVLAPSVHPHLNQVGLMLPTTPMHALLLQGCGRPLVCTSGNREGEPLEFEVSDAEKNLHGVCDAWLHHNRPILHPIDDSVVRVIAGRPVTFRLARGLAPLRLDAPAPAPLLATGGHLKAAFAWSNGSQALLGPHIGDLDSLSTRNRYVDSVRRMEGLYRFSPKQLVHDRHPEYFTTHWAQSQATPKFSVQHHHAHAASGMLEHGWLDRPVLAAVWDGTGYGTDGQIWGGEFLLVDSHGWRRAAHLRPFRLPGGDLAAGEPWRAAAVLLHQALGHQAALGHRWRDVSQSLVKNLLRLAAGSRRIPSSTSMGRLFDAAACLILGVERSAYEASAAMFLEAAADRREPGSYTVELDPNGSCWELDWRPMIREIAADVHAERSPGVMAMRFHRAAADAVAQVGRKFPGLPIVLGGGVFQNRLLVELLVDALPGRELGLPGVIPPGDGGLAAGQLAAAILHGA